MLDMTRTTGTSPVSRRSMNAVVIPAATETTSRPGGTAGAISASSLPMSCGLTARTRVSASFAADAASVTSIPYRACSSAPRSSRRTAATTADGGRPARSSPDSSASPIFPVPRMAITGSRPGSERKKNDRLAGRSASLRIR